MPRYQRLETVEEDVVLETVPLEVVNVPPYEAPMMQPPSYEPPTEKLPTYQEVQKTSTVVRSHPVLPEPEVGGVLLGNDAIFVACLIIALCFNWLGYLLVICMGRSIAAHNGALAGFGLAFLHVGLYALHHHNIPVDNGTKTLHISLAAAIVFTTIGALFMFRGISVYTQAKRAYAALSN